MKVAEIVVKILEKRESRMRLVFREQELTLFTKNWTSTIKHYCVRHEEAQCMRQTVIVGLLGRWRLRFAHQPGATNFVTGIYTANVDSIPCWRLPAGGHGAVG